MSGSGIKMRREEKEVTDRNELLQIIDQFYRKSLSGKQNIGDG